MTDSGTLVLGDNLEVLTELKDGSIDLIYIDPPFKSDRRRTTARNERGFDDRWPGDIKAYLAFLEPRLVQMRRLLSERGSLYVHVDWRTVHYIKVSLDVLFGSENFLNEVIWSYRTGGRSKRWFARKHDTLLVYARNSDRHTFNIIRDGKFRTDGLCTDTSGRLFKSTRKGRLYFHTQGPALTDVWEMPFLSTVSRERTGYPTQKPLALLERIITVSSNPGDLVGDFFCGSGTTLVAANRLNRRWIGCDSEPSAIQVAGQRLALMK